VSSKVERTTEQSTSLLAPKLQMRWQS